MKKEGYKKRLANIKKYLDHKETMRKDVNSVTAKATHIMSMCKNKRDLLNINYKPV